MVRGAANDRKLKWIQWDTSGRCLLLLWLLHLVYLWISVVARANVLQCSQWRVSFVVVGSAWFCLFFLWDLYW
jgi:hypothetical protein